MRYPWLALVALCVAVFISTVDTTIVAIALPDIATDLGATTADLQWVMDSYTIALAGLILLGGGLADRFGRKRVFITGLTVFALTSLLATFAHSTAELIAYRALMGVGAALILPPALSLIAVIFPPEQRRAALAIWSLIAGIGVALGPVVGGVLLNNFWWGSAFLVNVPVALVTAGAALVLLPESRRPGAPALDVLGAVLSVLALGGLIYGIIEGPHIGWLDPEILAALGLGAAMVAAFAWRELSQRDPLFDVRVLAEGPVLAGFTAIFLFCIVLLGVSFLIPQYLQSVEQRSTLAAGAVMLPLGIGQMMTSPLSPRLASRLGYRRTLALVLAGLSAGVVIISQLAGFGGLVVVLGGLLFVGAALGSGWAPATAVVMNALPVEKAGDGSAVNQVARQVGAAFGIALAGTILAVVYSADVEPATTGLSAEQATTAQRSITGATTVADDLPPSEGAALERDAGTAFERGVEIALWAMAALLAAGALLTYRLLRAPPAQVKAPALSPGS